MPEIGRSVHANPRMAQQDRLAVQMRGKRGAQPLQLVDRHADVRRAEATLVVVLAAIRFGRGDRHGLVRRRQSPPPALRDAGLQRLGPLDERVVGLEQADNSQVVAEVEPGGGEAVYSPLEDEHEFDLLADGEGP